MLVTDVLQNWCKEFNKWLGCERINVFAVTSEKRPSVSDSI